MNWMVNFLFGMNNNLNANNLSKVENFQLLISALFARIFRYGDQGKPEFLFLKLKMANSLICLILSFGSNLQARFNRDGVEIS